jgi:hypothetical protein
MIDGPTTCIYDVNIVGSAADFPDSCPGTKSPAIQPVEPRESRAAMKQSLCLRIAIV